MDSITVGDTTYTKRPYSKGGHGWLRPVRGASSATGQSEVGAEMKALLDRIERLEVANGADKPSVIGHDRAVLDRFTKPLYVAARVQGDYTDIRDLRRGCAFDVRLEYGHVATVTVELTDFRPHERS